MGSKEAESKYSKLQWFLFVVVIPLLFTITLSLVLLTIAGINVFEYAKEFSQKTPILSKYVSSDNSGIEKAENLQVQIGSLEENIKEKESQILQLEDNLQGKQDEIVSLQIELEQLANELLLKEEEQLIKIKSLEEITEMYDSMSPKNAAVILPKLDNEEAVKILSSLKTDKVAMIMEKMNPEDAAKYTQLLTE